ncbi:MULTISPECIES: DUF3515 domain-containing protein [Actinokineospora]|uniref:DUF3515 domain-containing protein n=1 Tax=Actinokineospora fastidiosa TaxID=1816 RepID=A0A918GQ91_9PSEU|nr:MULTISPECIES: DUF3515 domain-containing protein [Actinokineospora]UVS81182.1 hypothetical protein Actkin_04937 [Actinokineospora sp. UTMC 2448]GGS51855.1 hypothetical protein GCM10010171_53640 [Actinokineospora fastidiosa]
MTEPRTAPPRAAVVAAAVLVGLLAVGVIVASRFAPDADQPMAQTGPLGLVPVDAPQSTSPDCADLLAALPAEVPSNGGVLAALPLADPAPAGAKAWGERLDPVVLRCGLRKPPELTPTSALQEVSGVKWLPVRGDLSTTWFIVDRPVYVALTMPDSAGSGPLQTISTIVGTELAAQPVDP